MRRIITGKIARRGVACILAVVLCLTSAFIGVDREHTQSTALAARQLSGDEVWEYEQTTSGMATITGYKGTDTQLHIPETIQDREGSSLAVTEIADYAFRGCTNLTSVEIPQSVTEMGKWVFAGCDSLTRVDLPDRITSIPDYTFYACGKLTDVGFPSALTEIGEGAFWKCESLAKLEIPEGVTKLGKYAFYQASSFKEIKLPDTLESIGDKAFVCTSLESLTIPKNVSAIGDGLFDGQGDTPEDCFTSIRQITVDEENKTFDSRDGSNAIIETQTGTLLYGSNATTKIPEGVKKIAMYAFSGCKDLESIEISSTVNMIAGHIFKKCNGLSQITVSEDNPKYDSRDGCNAILQGSMLVVGCKATKIPADVSSLEIAAFSGCTALTEIELPSSLREIPDMAFMSCSSLKSIKIPYGVTAIKTYAFHYCTSLERVYIPSTVETFDGFSGRMDNVFLGCQNLTIYTTEGAKAVEFAEEFKIPYSFETMPEETKSPQPQETLTPQPQETSAPQHQETLMPQPQETSAPQHQETLMPQPQETLTPQPQETLTPQPQETLAPQPQETLAPQPQETLAPQPQETLTPQPQETPVPQPQGTLTPAKTETVGMQPPQETVKPDIQKPEKPKIKKLKNKSGKKVTVTLSKKVAGADGYQVAYAAKSSMKGQKTKSFKGTSVTIKGLEKKKMYYFRVRAFVKENGKTVYGSWGKIKSIKIKK